MLNEGISNKINKEIIPKVWHINLRGLFNVKAIFIEELYSGII